MLRQYKYSCLSLCGGVILCAGGIAHWAGLTTSHAHAWLGTRNSLGCPELLDRCAGRVPVVGNVECLGGRKPGIGMGGACEGREKRISLAHKHRNFQMCIGYLQITIWRNIYMLEVVKLDSLYING